MKSKAKATVQITAENRTGRGLSSAQKGLKAFDRKLNRIVGSGVKNLTKISSGLVAVGAAAGTAFAADSLRKFSEFEANMKGVEAVLKPTTKEFEALEAEAKRLGRTTKFSAREAAQGIEILAKNGVKTDKILGGMLEASLKLSASLGSELAESADTLTDVMSVFNIETEKASEVVDSINAVAINSKFGFEDYAKALASGGASAVAAGQSLEEFNETITATASFFDAGETAGTAYKVFIDRLIPASDAAEAAQKKLGLSVFNSNGELKDMAVIAGQLQRGLAKLTEEERIQAITDLFGTKGKNFAVALARAGEEGIKSARFLSQFADATAQAEKRMEGTQGALTKLKSAFEGFQLTVGEPLADNITPFIDALSKKFSAAAEDSEAMGESIDRAFLSGIEIGADLIDVVGEMASLILRVGAGAVTTAKSFKQLSLVIANLQGSDEDLLRIGDDIRDLEKLEETLASLAVKTSDGIDSDELKESARKILKDAQDIRQATAVLRDEERKFLDLTKLLQQQTVNGAEPQELETIKKLITAQDQITKARRDALNELKGIAPESQAELAKIDTSTKATELATKELAKTAGVSMEEAIRAFEKLNDQGGEQLEQLEGKLDGLQRKLKETTGQGQKFHDEATQNSWLKDFALEGIGFIQGLISKGFDPLSSKLKTITAAGAVASGTAISAFAGPIAKENKAAVIIDDYNRDQPFGQFGGFGFGDAQPLPGSTDIAIIEKQYEEKLALLKKYGLEETDIAKQQELEKLSAMGEIRQLQISGVGSAFDSMLQLTEAFGKKQSGAYKALFAVSKGFAIAESVVAIQTAVAKAAAIGFPANIPLIAQAISQGASIVSTIKGTQPSFEGGGFTGVGARTGGVDGRGGFHAVLHPNETVVDHTRSNLQGGGNNVYITIYGDPNPSVVEDIKQAAAQMALAKVADTHNRGGSRSVSLSRHR